MSPITEDIRNAIEQIRPAMVATAGKDGRPNVSPKGSLQVLDGDYLVFSDLRSPRTIANLKENPYISIIGLDPSTRKGWRVWGKAEEILSSGELYDRYNQFYADRGGIKHVVKIRVEEASVF
jgi:uncharacterized protein